MLSGAWDTLRKEIEEYSEELLPVLKALANKHRLIILSYLLSGPKSFNFLLKHINLKKTALSNHLSNLIECLLVERPDYGTYKLSPDTLGYIRGIITAWKQSYQYESQRLSKIQSKEMSSGFINSFF